MTRGLFRHAAVERTEIEGLVYHDERLAFIDTADVVLQSTTDFMADGYLITPNITFGLNTPINWTSFILEAENLDVPGVKVEYFASTDSSAILDPTDPNWVIVETYTDPAQTGLEKAVIKTQSNQLALQVKLTRSTALTTAPNVTRFAVRGLPAHRDWVCDVPINISDIVTAPGRMPIRVPGQGDSEHIKVLGLQGKSTTLKVYDPPATFRGIVESIAEPTTFITDRGSQGRYCLVRFLGILVGTDPLSAVQGNAGMGITTMGIGTMGIGQT